MKKRLALLPFLLFLTTEIFCASQGRVMWCLSDKNDIFFGNCDLTKHRTLDTSRLNITYCFRMLQDTLKADAKFDKRDTVILQVGKDYTKFYGLIKLRADSSQTRLTNEGPTFGTSGLRKIDTANFVHYQIIRDIKAQKITFIDRLPFKMDAVISYEESVPSFGWKLTNRTKNIYSYTCYEAITTFGGRQWMVWFTPEIPVNAGPWKFSGLPGLILEAHDTQNHFVINVISISAEVSPIFEYQWRGTRTTKKKWQKLQHNFYTNPFHSISVDATFEYLNHQTGDFEKCDETWSIPYNPIERYK